MIILGISSYYHDSAACITKDGIILSAVQEERFTRVKHDKSFPENSIKYCLDNNKIKIEDVNYVAFYDNWYLKKKRNFDNVLTHGHLSSENFLSSVYNQIKEQELIAKLKKLFLWNENDLKSKLYYIQHHYSHAASAYYCSPFEESSIITVDGVGEFSTTTIGYGKNKNLSLIKSIDFPNSLGLFYSAFTNYLGFKVNTGEYKLMGLAPYGNPIFQDKILNNIISLNDDGSYKLNMEYFRFQYKNEMVNFEKIEQTLEVSFRNENQEISREHKDLAASVQSVLEKALINLVNKTIKETNCKNLSLAGGVALNCKALGVLRNMNLVKNIFVQPAAGDAGGALGAAIALHYKLSNVDRKINHKFNVYSGPEINNENVNNFLIKRGCPHKRIDPIELPEIIAKKLSEGKTFAICNGKAEWGPRALGSRSIIANPMIKDIKKLLNLKIKQREDFRPFAPIIDLKYADKIFMNANSSPFMSFVFFLKEDLRDKKSILSINGKHLSSDNLNNIKSSVIHNDWSARVQTVDQEKNKFLYLILEKFFEITGCPLLINTSFNTRGEPPVLSVQDAFRCLMRTQIDYLVLNNIILDRNDQPLLSPNEIEVFDPD
jgi:carbamoyltransferase